MNTTADAVNNKIFKKNKKTTEQTKWIVAISKGTFDRF